jgi:hypothetical protein
MHSVHDIIYVRALCNDSWPAIDHRIENRPGLIVVGVTGHYDISSETLAKTINSNLFDTIWHNYYPSLNLLTGH